MRVQSQQIPSQSVWTHIRQGKDQCVPALPTVLFQNSPDEQRGQAHTERKDLPEQNAVRPDVTQGGVEVVKDALRSHPLHWQEGLGKQREEIKPHLKWKGSFLG